MQQSVKERLCILYQHTTDTGTAPCPRVTHTLTEARGSIHTYEEAGGVKRQRGIHRERTGADTQPTRQTDRQTEKESVSD